MPFFFSAQVCGVPLNENSPNPFGGGGKILSESILWQAMVLFWHGFDLEGCLRGGDTKTKLPNGNGHLFFKQEGEICETADELELYSSTTLPVKRRHQLMSRF